MSIWVLHASFTPDEEAHIKERTYLPLPFTGLPDLSVINGQIECRHLLQALNPDDPPEAITRKVEQIWRIYAGLQPEDIIVVPLKSRQEVALAEVTQRYHYQVGADGDDVHQVKVKWHDARIKFWTLRKHKEILDERGGKLREIGNAEARIIIRDRLPHSYNRFVKWKWLLIFFFVMGLISRLKHLATVLH
jgi:hypothetical protein